MFFYGTTLLSHALNLVLVNIEVKVSVSSYISLLHKDVISYPYANLDAGFVDLY